MKQEIIILTDYKGHFGSKQKSEYYQSGMDVSRLKELFVQSGFSVSIKGFHQIDFRRDDFTNRFVLYTSSEDPNYFYKNYIDDILMGIKMAGGKLIPDYILFKAHDNKVFMEILRDLILPGEAHSIRTKFVGTHEDLINVQNEISYPAVIKKPSGAMSKGVFLAKDNRMLKKISKKISFCQDFFYNFKELIRSLKYKGYTKSSSHRKKFIIQDFIPGLTHDWKILIFGKKFYVLKRYNRKNDFRASGGGRLEYTSDIPESLLNFAEKIYNTLNTPILSLDVVFDGNKNHLFEFQCIYFGTTTLEYSSFFFLKNEGAWQKQNGSSDLETEYVTAVSEHIRNIYTQERVTT